MHDGERPVNSLVDHGARNRGQSEDREQQDEQYARDAALWDGGSVFSGSVMMGFQLLVLL